MRWNYEVCYKLLQKVIEIETHKVQNFLISNTKPVLHKFHGTADYHRQ